MAEWVTINGRKYLKFKCMECGKETMFDESSFDVMQDVLGMDLESMLLCPDCILAKRRKKGKTLTF
jgi:DNA-directed RNA polymerase subunit RPC12/RpoP